MSAVLSSPTSFDCREAEPLLHLYDDGEAAPEDQSALEAHLERCDECRHRLRELRAVKQALRSRAAEDATVPEALVLRLRGQIAQVSRGERRRRSFALAAPAVAATGALVFAGAALFGSSLASTFGIGGGATEDTDLQSAAFGGSAPSLLEEALSLHTLDVPVDVASPDPSRVGSFLASRIGHPVRVPRLDPAGLGLAGGRVINVHNQRAAQLVYESGLGGRVSLVAVPDPSGRLSARVVGGAEAAATSNVDFAGWVKGSGAEQSGHLRARQGDLAVHVWSSGGTVYSLAGQMDDAHLDSLLSEVAGGGRARARSVSRVAHEYDPPLRNR